MKNLFFIPFFILAIVQELPAQLNEDGIIFRFSGAPRLVAEIVGIGRVTSVVLADATPFYLEASILGRSFNIDPNNLIFDYWRVGFYYSSLPVVVRVFSDRTREHLIGVANNVLRIEKAYSTTWSVNVNDVYFLDENYRPKNYSSDDFLPDSKRARRVDIPTIQSELSTVVQFINLTSSEVTVTEVGPIGSDLAKYGVYPSTYSGLAKSRKQKIGPFSFGSFEVHLPIYSQYNQSVMYWIGGGGDPRIVDVGPNPGWGPRAVQFVIK